MSLQRQWNHRTIKMADCAEPRSLSTGFRLWKYSSLWNGWMSVWFAFFTSAIAWCYIVTPDAEKSAPQSAWKVQRAKNLPFHEGSMNLKISVYSIDCFHLMLEVIFTSKSCLYSAHIGKDRVQIVIVNTLSRAVDRACTTHTLNPNSFQQTLCRSFRMRSSVWFIFVLPWNVCTSSALIMIALLCAFVMSNLVSHSLARSRFYLAFY